ncbi:MAG: TonB-dependent receptor [Sphingobium sp.]
MHRKLLFGSILFASASALPFQALAQSPGASTTADAPQERTARSTTNDDFGEIIVTANRRAESSQNVGIAISAFSGELVKNLNVTQSIDIARFSPGVSATGAQGGFLQTFSIRGVTQNDFNPHQEAPVAAYIDEVYISSIQGQAFAVFDTDRVEILKGPQGTLFGRNATGGLVHYVTTKPDTTAVSGYGSLSYGRFNMVRAEAALNVPVTDKIAVRAAGVYGRRDPILKNLAGPGQWDDRLRAGRLHILLEPSEDFRVLLSGRYGYQSTSISAANQYPSSIAILDALGNTVDQRPLGPTETAQVIVAGVPVGTRPCGGCDFFGYKDPDGSGRTTSDSLVGKPVTVTTSPGKTRTYSEAYGFTGNFQGQSGDITANFIADYSHFRWRVGSGLTGGTAFPFGFDTNAKGIDQMSGEFRVSGDHENFRWVLGTYYLSIQSENVSGFGDVTGGAFGFGSPADQVFNFSQKTSSYSFFGQAEYDLTDQLTLIGGARYINDEKKFSFIPTFETGTTSFPAGPSYTTATNPGENPLKANLVTWKIGLNYKVTPDVLLYATANRGVKAGGFNAPSNPLAGIPFLFAPEVLYAYETGFKSSLIDRLLTLNGSIYYYDYKSSQKLASIGTSTYLLSTPAKSYGGELQISSTPAQGLNLSVNAAYTHAKADNVLLGGITKDRTPPFSPKFQVSGYARYEMPVSFGKAWLQVDGSYTSSHYVQLDNYTNNRNEAYALLNARVGVGSDGDTGWSLTGEVQNVTNVAYKTSSFATAGNFGSDVTAYNMPRTYSLTARYTF